MDTKFYCCTSWSSKGIQENDQAHSSKKSLRASKSAHFSSSSFGCGFGHLSSAGMEESRRRGSVRKMHFLSFHSSRGRWTVRNKAFSGANSLAAASSTGSAATKKILINNSAQQLSGFSGKWKLSRTFYQFCTNANWLWRVRINFQRDIEQEMSSISEPW